jgi:hypothetical protein
VLGLEVGVLTDEGADGVSGLDCLPAFHRVGCFNAESQDDLELHHN